MTIMKKGLYLASPHGRLIYEGNKTLIAVAKRLPIEGERVVCSKEDGKGLAYGIAIIGPPGVVDIETFDTRFSAHRVPRASRLKWWPDAQRLYLYPITYFMPFADPCLVDVPPGTTMDMSSEVKFLNEEQEDSAKQTPFDGDSNLAIMSSSDTIGGDKEKITMPWKPGDAQSHTKKADTPEKQKLWASTANSRLAACVKEGGDHKECEASAVRVANAAVAKSGEKQVDELDDQLRKALSDILGGDDALNALISLIETADDKAGDDGEGDPAVCTCPSCKEESDGEPDTPCKELECPECGAQLRGGSPDDSEDKAAAQEEDEEEKPKEDEDEQDKDEKAGRRFSNSILGKLRKLGESITELIQHGEYADQTPEPKPDPVADIATQLSKGFKSLGVDSQGRTWFTICPTNAYFDREMEAFETKALNDYVDRHADSEVKGEAWFWHAPGSKFGTIREQAVVGDHFVCQLGTYDNTPIGNTFKSFFGKYPDSHPVIAPNGWGASHKYDYILEDREDSVYEFFEIKESTVLPLHVAANVHNLQPTMGGLKTMNAQQTEAIDAIGKDAGVPDLVEQITAQANAAKEELDAKGVKRKEASESEQQSASSEATPDATPDTDVSATVKAIAEALQLDSLSKMLSELAASAKSQDERLAALEILVGRTEEERKAIVAGELPRYAWEGFKASEADETVKDDKDVKTVDSGSISPVIDGLVSLMGQ